MLAAAPCLWPFAARAQQATRSIGLLGATSASEQSQWVAALVQRLRELGWVEGRNLAITYRWANGSTERAAEMAAELVGSKVDVIVTSAGPMVAAAKRATTVVPIVFATAADPVGAG